jgi:3-dehydroquinate dehydratase-2
MQKILIIHGPNLNTLGTREPEIYGNKKCAGKGALLGVAVTCYQSNVEGDLVTQIQDAGKEFSGLIVNAGAYTHTSIAMMDALLTLKIPVIEVHLSNIFRREEFRHQSYISKAAKGVICGFGSDSYMLALEGMKKLVNA